jgi:hypothetical protein
MIKLHNFGMNGRTTSVRHYEAVETEHHARVAFDLPRHVDCGHMAMDSGSLILSWVNNGCAEGITDLGVGAGQRVIEANTKCQIQRHPEAGFSSQPWNGTHGHD